ncbi:sigma-70 family RNA polymerase sigma factor [Pseudomonas sp. nanlin1]|uniref:sigma-70 family RNA polymerase sigma factor n=1 Tax=Pseudomonas sp. nanlin1 TaxID=3040605 RepID=UPI00389114CE
MHALDASLRDLLPRLRRFALSLTHEASSADDLVQACLERALAHWHNRQAHSDLRAWLFAILYRQFIDGHRRAKRDAQLLAGLNEDPAYQPSTERSVLAQSALQAFAQLKPEQRALLYAVSVEGLSYQQAADMLQVPIGTVMSRLSRAREALRRLSEGEINSAPVLRILK